MNVIDLFCGCGGFSSGATRAGARVILAIDNWQQALNIHKKHHPDTHHVTMRLGGDVQVFSQIINDFIEREVPPGEHVHLHGSPPCQNLCHLNTTRNADEGNRLVEWYLQCTKFINASSWTMEQVCGSHVAPLLKRFHGVIIRVDSLGVPSTRKRLILSSPGVDFTKLQDFHMAPPTMREILREAGEDFSSNFICQTNGRD